MFITKVFHAKNKDRSVLRTDNYGTLWKIRVSDPQTSRVLLNKDTDPNPVESGPPGSKKDKKVR